MPDKRNPCAAFARVALTLLLTVALVQTAPAQIPSYGVDTFQPPPDAHWAAITVQDVEAAYQLLRDNHPGAAPELHDDVFQNALAMAHALALGRARSVTSYQGYIATLAGFATDMGDKHIWSRPVFNVAYPRWAGMIISKRGDNWVVSDTDRAQSARMGATLLSCDNQNVQELARKNLGGFRADWSVGAQQTQSAPWLLIDEQNPFIERPRACVFEHNGARETLTLEWIRIRRETLLPRIQKAAGAGAAGYGIRQVGNGYWIALQDLSSPQVADVVAAAEAQKAALRDAPFVVLDLRGNRGGSSAVGRRIADSLMGNEAVAVRLGAETESDCGSPDGAWRVSDGNLHNLEHMQHVVLQGGPEVKKIFEDLLRDARAAQAQGKAFSGPLTCPHADKPAVAASAAATTPPPSLMKGRLLLLTDNACFSSCLSVTDDYRHLGAFHIGQTTDANTHYSEVREQYLPSGYSLFSTLQAVFDPDGPRQFGPFEPALSYQGDIADTAALEKWVLEVALPAAKK